MILNGEMDGKSVYDGYIWMNEYDGMINFIGESNRKKKEVI